MRYYLLILLAVFILPCPAAEEIFQSPQDFIQENFKAAPSSQVLWLTGELKSQVKKVLGHDYHKLRIRYWQQQQRSAWVLEEIGKEHYITAGFVIDDNSLERVKILIFRENRGWEIKHDYFTQQFKNAKLNSSSMLDTHIDNITGATLSVRAIKRLAQLALFFHQTISYKKNEPTAAP